MNALSASDLAAHCAPLTQPTAHTTLATRSGLPVEAAALWLSAVCSEAQTGLRLFREIGPQPNYRVLEVGAGGGLLSGFLQSCGVNLVAVEPAAEGFEKTPHLTKLIREFTGVSATILPLAARDLSPDRHGTFNVIFSVNVIEHFQPLHENLDALARVMSSGGIQVHTCPNYHMPYEPHFGIPLLPFAPSFTPFLSSLRAEGLWRSLNFVTSSDIMAYAKRCALMASFKRGMLSEALERVCNEPAFRARHPGLLHRIARAVRATGMMGLLGRMPPSCVTPMTFTLRRRTGHYRPGVG